MNRRKSTVSATSSFVSDRNGSFLRATLTKEDRGVSGTFPEPEHLPDSRKSVVLPEILEQPTHYEENSSSILPDLNFKSGKVGLIDAEIDSPATISKHSSLNESIDFNEPEVTKFHSTEKRDTLFFSELQEQTMQQRVPDNSQNRLKQVANLVKEDELQGFRLWGVKKEEMISMRFEYNMNLLQLACFEEATCILRYITEVLADDAQTRLSMGKHRENNLGSQAIHLAATTGNRPLIETLLNNYYADAAELNNEG